MEKTDEQLVVAYLAGDDALFPLLVDRYMRSLYGFIFQMIQDDAATEDIIQETFIKVWKHLGRFDQKKSFKTWIFAIAKNTAFDHLKKKKTLPFSLFQNEENGNALENISDGSVHPEEILDREATAQELERKLLLLPPVYRTLLYLHYQQGFSLREIALVLSEPYNTIKSRHGRSLQALKRAFGQDNASQEDTLSYS